MSSKNTKIIIQTLKMENEKAMKAIHKRNELIQQMYDNCQHEWIWLNDPFDIYHHECAKCGKTTVLNSIKSKMK